MFPCLVDVMYRQSLSENSVGTLVDLRKMTRNIPVVFMFLDQILPDLRKEILAWLQS
jgi:hypothetical protein